MKKKILISVVCLLLINLVGCSGPEPTQKQQCLEAQITYKAVVDGLTMFKDRFSPDEVNEITIFIHGGQECLNRWNASFKDPNMAGVDWSVCINNTVAELARYYARAKGGD